MRWFSSTSGYSPQLEVLQIFAGSAHRQTYMLNFGRTRHSRLLSLALYRHLVWKPVGLKRWQWWEHAGKSCPNIPTHVIGPVDRCILIMILFKQGQSNIHFQMLLNCNACLPLPLAILIGTVDQRNQEGIIFSTFDLCFQQWPFLDSARSLCLYKWTEGLQLRDSLFPGHLSNYTNTLIFLPLYKRAPRGLQ